MYTRKTDPTPTKCLSCGWIGKLKEATHSYYPFAEDDVEPMDFCPLCGNSQLTNIAEDKYSEAVNDAIALGSSTHCPHCEYDILDCLISDELEQEIIIALAKLGVKFG